MLSTKIDNVHMFKNMYKFYLYGLWSKNKWALAQMVRFGKQSSTKLFFFKILNWTKLNERNQLISLVRFGFIFFKTKYVQFDQWAFSWAILDRL